MTLCRCRRAYIVNDNRCHYCEHEERGYDVRVTPAYEIARLNAAYPDSRYVSSVDVISPARLHEKRK